jgi:hypothetical protein
MNFPAAILQPPFFDARTDIAQNYGGIGTVIGHEISHSFDDQGSLFDAQGRLANWWSDEDFKQFRKAADRLVAQYDDERFGSTRQTAIAVRALAEAAQRSAGEEAEITVRVDGAFVAKEKVPASAEAKVIAAGLKLGRKVQIEIAQSLLDAALTDEWRSQFYHVTSAEDVAEHLAYNMARELELFQLDGFADQPKSAVKCGRLEPVDSAELVPVKTKRKRAAR